MKIRTLLIRSVVAVAALLLTTPPLMAQRQSATYPRANRTEAKADRNFIRGEYILAMELYEQANKSLPGGSEQKLKLELKMARLHTLLLNSDESMKYYQKVYDRDRNALSVNDICFFIDALRRNNQEQRAEIISRSYAFSATYSRNQRYLNTLHSLINKQRYYGRGDSEYAVRRLESSTPLAEFWIGDFGGKTIYAVSHSQLQDPLKIYYHRTQYMSLDGGDQYEQLHFIPSDMQSGPMTFADNNKLMVTTSINYKKDQIGDPSSEEKLYKTRLYYSVYDTKRERWSKFRPLFPFQDGYSFAHPHFFNEGRSLLFSSDRPGGFGGMDLYMTHWNENERVWEEPTNLGPAINTEGDEVYPCVHEGTFYFSSNGHEGFGGYDLYRVRFDNNIVLPGSLSQLPYPVNTTYNDFGIYFGEESGYFISDRAGAEGKDDIYTFVQSNSSLNSESAAGVSDEYAAMLGNLSQIRGMKESNTTTQQQEVLIASEHATPTQGEILLSIYFDFNYSTLDNESVGKLSEMLKNKEIQQLSEILSVGYADEFGTVLYNKHLSTRRAEAVQKFLVDNGFMGKITVEGRGKKEMTPQEYLEAMRQDSGTVNLMIESKIPNTGFTSLSREERIALNRKYRRVDLIVKSK